MDDRRKYFRLKGRHSVRHEKFTIPRGAEINENNTKNISVNGLLFESKKFYELGTVLRLELLLKGIDKFKTEFYKSQKTSSTQPFVVLGKVARVEVLDTGMFDIGVSLVGLDFGDRLALVKYIDTCVKELG